MIENFDGIGIPEMDTNTPGWFDEHSVITAVCCDIFKMEN